MAQWKIGGRQAACSACAQPFKDGERHHSMVRISGDRVDRFDGCQACWDAKRFGPECPDPVPQEPEPASSGPAGSDHSGPNESALDESAPDGAASADSTSGKSSAVQDAGSGAPEIDGESGESGEAERPEPHRFWWTTRHQEQVQKTVAMDMDALQRLFLELQGREERNLRELRYVLCLLLMRKKRVKLERILREESGESFIVRRPKTEERYTVEVFDFTPERMGEIREHLQAIFDGVDHDESLAAAARGEDVEGAASDPEGTSGADTPVDGDPQAEGDPLEPKGSERQAAEEAKP